MGYNTKSETNPTGSTQTLNTQYNPLDKSVTQSNFQVALGFDAVYGGHYPEFPFRPAEYQQNWSGSRYFQTWDELGGMFSADGNYEFNYRKYVTGGNVNATVQLLLSRNQPAPYAPAPIALQQYALNTQQVYVGSDYTGGYYG